MTSTDTKDAKPLPKPVLEGVDYVIDPASGFMVLTAAFLRKRGSCCGSGCRNCPYSPEEQKKAGRATAR